MDQPSVTQMVVDAPAVDDPSFEHLILDWEKSHGPVMGRIRTRERRQDGSVVTFPKERIAIYFRTGTAILERPTGAATWTVTKNPDTPRPAFDRSVLPAYMM